MCTLKSRSLFYRCFSIFSGRRGRRIRLRSALGILLCVSVCALASGCTRIVYAPAGEPVLIREDIVDAPVSVLGEDGEFVDGLMTIPAGWWALPDPDEVTVREVYEFE